MVKDTELEKTARKRGSVDDFERDWQEALSGNLQRYLIYPADKPTTQFELFEHIKAEYVSESLKASKLQNGIVLEYGCGAAGMSAYLAARGFRVVACDLSFNALRLANINAQQHLAPDTLQQFHSVAANTFQLPFSDEAFDVVMSYGLLEHFAPEALDSVLVEVVRTLRPGGLFVADIAHGRFSSRQVGAWISLATSLLFHFITLRWQKLEGLPGAYLKHYYENDLDEQAWGQALKRADLSAVQVRIYHPFPPLALSGWPEKLYVALMQWAHPVWQWFDRAQPRWGRFWGWLYIADGIKAQRHN